jgi:hypothetical protein
MWTLVASSKFYCYHSYALRVSAIVAKSKPFATIKQ